jgi:putative phage-type endonuclease
MSLTRAQKAARRRGVGGSEMLAALGKDPRCSRVELYMRKLGELPEPDFADNDRVRFGTLLEPVIRKEFERRIGEKVLTVKQTHAHPLAPLVGNFDGFIPRLKEGVEIKCADKFEAQEFGELDTDQVPVRYLVQCSAYMAITDTQRWHLAVLIGGNELRTYVIPRDEQIEAAILAGARAFWQHVEERRPPAAETPEDVKLLWPKSLGKFVAATPEIIQSCRALAIAKRELKEAEQREAGFKMEIQQFMQDASELVDEHGEKLATWRTNKDSEVLDTKAFAAAHPELHRNFLITRTGARPFLLKTR